LVVIKAYLRILLKVNFPNQQFDLGNEYDPATSTFIPAMAGVYIIQATITFQPNFNDRDINFFARANIRLNGNFVKGVDTGYRLAGNLVGAQNPPNIVTVSTILQLEAGDRVDVTAQSSRAVNITPQISVEDNVEATYFTAARLPSPNV
jgi:ribosomal protein L6P/L9E